MKKWQKLFGAGAALLGGYIYFNRNPMRSIPYGNNVLAPADGIASRTSDKRIDIKIGLSDVHFQRIPYPGTITDITDYPEDNSNTIRLQTDLGEFIIGRRGGILARSVRSSVKVGDIVHAGDIFGRILLGSHCYLIVPDSVTLTISDTVHVLAGESIVGTIVLEGM